MNKGPPAVHIRKPIILRHFSLRQLTFKASHNSFLPKVHQQGVRHSSIRVTHLRNTNNLTVTRRHLFHIENQLQFATDTNKADPFKISLHRRRVTTIHKARSTSNSVSQFRNLPLHTFIGLRNLLRLNDRVNGLQSRVVVHRFTNMLTIHPILRRIHVHIRHHFQHRSRANIHEHSLHTTNFKSFRAQRLRTKRRSHRAPRLMILTYKVLPRRRRALKLLILNYKHSKRRKP